MTGFTGLRLACLLMPLLLLLSAPLAAQQAAPPPAPLDRVTVQSAVERLKPGEYLWAPQVAPAGPILLIVNVTTQRGILYRNGLPIGITTVSTGRDGHRTPTGVFTVLQRQVEHYSSLYENAPMPYMQRLTWDGVALHGGVLPGYPASHGCIRLPKKFARLLYAETRLGMTVMVVAQDALPALAPTTAPLPTAAGDTEATGSYVWYPERAPTGPVSIVVSVADRMLVVLRNGREIGTADVGIAADIAQPLLFLFDSTGPSGDHWSRVALPIGGTAPMPVLSAADITPPAAFQPILRAILTPGATVLIIPDSIGRRPPVPAAPPEDE